MIPLDTDEPVRKQRLTETEVVLDALPHPTFAINQDYRIIRMNRAALNLSGAARYEEAIGNPCHLLLHSRENKCPFCPIMEEFQDPEKKRKPLEKIVQEKDVHGIERTLRITFVHTGHERINLVEKIEDITNQQEQHEEELRRENLTALGTMISGIAHELNNPLTGMGLTLQNLMANLSAMENDEVLKRLHLVQKDLRRASRIVTDILAFSRPGQIRLVQADIRMTLLRAKEAILRLYPILTRRINWIIEGEPSVIIDYQQEKMERVFFNLFRNSIQAFDYNEGYIRVDFKKTRKNVHIIIEDNAGGIPEGEISKIFNPFFSREKSGTGSGLGLSICYSTVKEHKGRIRVRSFSGKTMFQISIPQKQGSHERY